MRMNKTQLHEFADATLMKSVRDKVRKEKRCEISDRLALYIAHSVHMNRLMKESAKDKLLASAEMGFAPAAYALHHLADIDGEAHDSEKWLRKASDGGFPEAQCALAMRMMNGLHKIKNEKERQSEFDTLSNLIVKSAAQGSRHSQFLLATMPSTSSEESLNLLLSSAKQMHPTAQKILAEKFLSGNGVDVDYILAYAWVINALINDETIMDNSRGMIDFMLANMTKEEILEAEEIAEEYYLSSKAKHDEDPVWRWARSDIYPLEADLCDDVTNNESDKTLLTALNSARYLKAWARWGGERLEYALSVDDQLKASPEWKGKAVMLRFREVERLTLAHFNDL